MSTTALISSSSIPTTTISERQDVQTRIKTLKEILTSNSSLDFNNEKSKDLKGKVAILKGDLAVLNSLNNSKIKEGEELEAKGKTIASLIQKNPGNQSALDLLSQHNKDLDAFDEVVDLLNKELPEFDKVITAIEKQLPNIENKERIQEQKDREAEIAKLNQRLKELKATHTKPSRCSLGTAATCITMLAAGYFGHIAQTYILNNLK
jgi:hypothetical protein